jgi:hypothetical protein
MDYKRWGRAVKQNLSAAGAARRSRRADGPEAGDGRGGNLKMKM